jgi:hypothetical protein
MADSVESVERATERCRQAVREAHAAVKDLNAAMAEQRDFLRSTAEDVARAEVALQVEQQVKLLGDATQRAMAASVAKVNAEFDNLAGILLGTQDGGPTLEDLIKKRRSK